MSESDSFDPIHEALRAGDRAQLRKDALKLQGWLETILADTAAYEEASPAARLRDSARLLSRGKSKTVQGALRKYQRWVEQLQAREAARSEETGEGSAAAFAGGEEAGEQPVSYDPAILARTRLIVYDLRGGGGLESTLAGSSLPLDAFADRVLVSPFALAGAPPEGFRLARAEAYLDLFDVLEAETRAESEAEFTLFLEAGAVPRAQLAAVLAALPDDADLLLGRVRSIEGGALSPVLNRESLLRAPLVPLVFPAIAMRSALARAWCHFPQYLHYTFWNLLLGMIEKTPGAIHTTEGVLASAPGHSYNLIRYQQEQLATSGDPLAARRPKADEEWLVTRHDLVTQIVNAHPEYFRENVAYLAAIAAATVGN
ncbi:MAG: hypothetical protein ACC661_12415 [Verrucomicrobiales bacterium]